MHTDIDFLLLFRVSLLFIWLHLARLCQSGKDAGIERGLGILGILLTEHWCTEKVFKQFGWREHHSPPQNHLLLHPRTTYFACLHMLSSVGWLTHFFYGEQYLNQSQGKSRTKVPNTACYTQKHGLQRRELSLTQLGGKKLQWDQIKSLGLLNDPF